MNNLIDRETKDIYIEETNQSLDDIENQLITLENMGADIDMAVAKKIFHAMHIIRNGASLLSLTKIKDLSQKIENVLGLICSNRLSPNPEVINILLQGIDRLNQLTDQVDNNEDLNIDEQSVLLTGLTSAVLPDDIKQSVTEVRDIPVPNGKHIFKISEFNLIQVLEQGKNIYILMYDLIKDVQEKNNTPLNFVRFVQRHGEMIDSVFDIKSIGTLEEQEFGSEMPYFVLLASTLSCEQLIKELDLQPYQIKPVNNVIADLIHPKTDPHQKELSSTSIAKNRMTENKRRLEKLNALFCELKFSMDKMPCRLDNTSSLSKARLQTVLLNLHDLLYQENNVLASKVLWKIGRNIRDYAYQSNIKATIDLQCGYIMMDNRILCRLIDPLTAITIKMVRLVQDIEPVQLCLSMGKNEDTIALTISYANPHMIIKKTHIDCHDEEKKLHALSADLKQTFESDKGLTVEIRVPQKVFIVSGYRVKIDNYCYIFPKFNVKDHLANLNPLKWSENDSSFSFYHEDHFIPIVNISNSDISYYKNKNKLIVCEVGGQRFGVAVDELETKELDAFCQSLGKQLAENPLIIYHCLLDNGQIAFIPDMDYLVNRIS